MELYNISEDPSEKSNVAAQHPEIVAKLQSRIEELAKQSAKPMFLIDRFGALQKGMNDKPVLPDEDAFYEGDEP
jgi:hypothetical protein